jgi:uncharacterized protein (TIGR02246 family)
MKKIMFLLTALSMQFCFAMNADDEERITGVINGYVESWNDQACVGFTDNFTDDCDFINIFGMYFHGKEAVQKRHEEILQTFLKDSVFTAENISMREIREGVVLAMVHWSVDGFLPPTENCGKKVITGIFSHIFILEDGKWKISATQNTLTK